MANLSREFLANLVMASVARSEIATELGTKESVSMALGRCARSMVPPHLVERHTSAGRIKYGLWPTNQGELPE